MIEEPKQGNPPCDHPTIEKERFQEGGPYGLLRAEGITGQDEIMKSSALFRALICCCVILVGFLTGSAAAYEETHLRRLHETGECPICNLQQASLTGANLRGSNLRGTNLREADLREANLRWTSLFNADLRGADLRNADLRGASLYKTDFREANLRGADFRFAHLVSANLEKADLREANLRGAKNLTQAQLDRACVDEKTILTKGLTRPEPCSKEDLGEK